MRHMVRFLCGVAVTCSVVLGVLWCPPTFAQPVVSYPDEPTRIAVRPTDSLASVQNRVRAMLRERPLRLIEVVLHEGVYRLDTPLALDWRDSPSGWGSVVWRAAEGERVTINGAREITGWEITDDGCWEADISGWPRGDFRELFADGVRRPRARHPNDGYLRVAKAGSDRRSYFYYRDGSLLPARRESGQELVLLHDWTITRVPVGDINRDSQILTPVAPIGNTLPMFHIDNWEPHPRYYLENDPGFLDAPGEWWIDTRRRTVRYRPHPGESPGKVRIEAPVAHRLLELRGSPDRLVRNIHFRDIHFAHCRWEPPNMGYFGIQATAYDPDRRGLPPGWVPAAIRVELAENITFQGGSVAHTGTGGIWLGGRTRDCAVRGMHVHDVAGNGIAVGEGAGGRWIDGVPWEVAAPHEAATGNMVADNLIERVGQIYHGSVGVWAGLTVRTTIAHNVVRHTPYTGISVGWKWTLDPTPARENRIEHNHIHDVMQVLSDGAGVYTLGRQPGTAVRGNLIHGVPESNGRAESNGMFFDQGSMHLRIEGNVVYDVASTPLRWNMAGPNAVVRNTIVHKPGVPPYRTRRMPDGTITRKHNTVIEADHWRPARPQLPGAGPREPYREWLPLTADAPSR